jgi:hypothetical protein
MGALEDVLGRKLDSDACGPDRGPGYISGNHLPTFDLAAKQRLEGGHDPLGPQPLIVSPEAIAQRMDIYFDNPWAMIEDGAIYTLDQADVINPVKLFPNRPWLQEITTEWLNEPLLAIFKSRRMTITWLFIFLHLWMVLFKEGRAVFFVSDKEEKSDELVQRAVFIYNHIPDELMLKPRIKPSYCYLEVPGLDSYIQGVAQGADQLRQYTASAIFADEFAFWEKARETFGASKPTIDGGGKFTCVSSPKEGFFKELCFDLIR